MSKKQSKTISTFGSRLTAIISVALVMLVLGVLAITLIVARQASESLQANISLVVRLSPQAPDSDILALKKFITSRNYVRSSTFTSAQKVLEQEMQLDDSILELLDGENPYQPEFEIKLKPAFTDTKSVKHIAKEFESLVQVDEVVTPANIAASIGKMVDRATIVLSAAAIILLIISIVLIFNTINLSIYSRRFLINTMQLVGATGNFIRMPFIRAGIVNGLFAGIAADAIIALMVWRIRPVDPVLTQALPWWPWTVIVLAGVLLGAILICAIASLVATNRYLRRDYDSMFTK